MNFANELVGEENGVPPYSIGSHGHRKNQLQDDDHNRPSKIIFGKRWDFVPTDLTPPPPPERWDSPPPKKMSILHLGYSKHIIFFMKKSHFLGDW